MRDGMRKVDGFYTTLVNTQIIRNLRSTGKKLICVKIKSEDDLKIVHAFINEFNIFSGVQNILNHNYIGKYIVLTINRSGCTRYHWSTLSVCSITPRLLNGNKLEKFTGKDTIDVHKNVRSFKHTVLRDSGILNISRLYSPRVITK